MAVFRTKLVKWGNSVGVTLPKPIRDTFNLEAGDEVELIDKNEYVMIEILDFRKTSISGHN
jgi:AbrB family looped-hinge helix DNA binding protein